MRRTSSVKSLVTVGEEFVEPDAAVPAGLLEWELAVIQQLDHGGTADAQQFGGLLGGQALRQ
jgi:hypothetical protein